MIALLLLMLQVLPPGVSLVPGTANTYTNGTYTWAGNPFCASIGNPPPPPFVLQPTSPARNAGFMPPETAFQCPKPGSALNQPLLPDGSYCAEWYESAVDIGACEFVPTAALVCTVGQNTLMGCYYSDMTFGTLVLVRDDGPSLNFDWGMGSPGPGVPPDNFSVDWQGDFNFLAGTYVFTITVDDGARVFVDGNLLIDAWIDQPPTTYTGQVTLTAGTHRVEMKYYENTGGAVAKLNWALQQQAPATPSNLQYQ